MKKESGVSLLEVIIAIIILLMIAFFAIYNSKNSIPKAKATEVYGEMKSVETAVEFVKSRMLIDEDFKLEEGKHYDEVGEDSGTYVIYGILDHGDCNVAKELGIGNLKRDYIVNYEKGEFKLKDAVDIQGAKVTTIDEVNALLNGGIK